ncbi:MAG: hypothetical protein ACRD3G_31945 [Vicinamibacterales bacterium]
MLPRLAGVLVFTAAVAFLFSVGSSEADAQAGRAAGQSTNWPTYGANLASHRYSAADQITKDNFGQLQIAWRLKTDFLGPRPDTLYSATPLLVDRVLYTTAGMRRAVIALNPASGEMLWMHAEDEGVRGQNAIRTGAGRGVAYWATANGSDRRIIYVTPGYRLKALDARTGIPISTFGKNGAVDLKREADSSTASSSSSWRSAGTTARSCWRIRFPDPNEPPTTNVQRHANLLWRCDLLA